MTQTWTGFKTTPLPLESGKTLGPVTLSYQTYGTLNPQKSNAILVCHALTGDAEAGQWWARAIGPGKAIDTNSFYVICINVIGSCKGSTGPASTNPNTKKPYKDTFPIITIADMITAQKALIDDLKIPSLKAVIGGSMGGMQALEWVAKYPDFVESCIPIATTARVTPQTIAFDSVGRAAIASDPKNGLAIARMLGHITYHSEELLEKKFARNLQDKDQLTYEIPPEFQVESYLKYQGDKFLDHFDANAYVTLTKAISYFDMPQKYGSLEKAFKKTNARFLVVSITSDWLYTPEQSKDIAKSLIKLNKDATYVAIKSNYGHDAFLIDNPELFDLIKQFLSPSPSTPSQPKPTPIRKLTRDTITEQVPKNSRVLDLGCASGTLLEKLIKEKSCRAYGIELDFTAIKTCTQKDIPVFQEDILSALKEFPDHAFDIVILSQTLQEIETPVEVLREILRIGKKAIITFPNFAYLPNRIQFLFSGHSPKSKNLPYDWHNTPNIRVITIKDFTKLCREENISIETKRPLTSSTLTKFFSKLGLANLLAERALFTLTTPSST